jgi:hypothetical protein
VRGPRKQARFRKTGVDRGDEQSLTQEVGDQPPDDQDQHGGEHGGQEVQKAGAGAAEAQRVDAEAGEDDEGGPEEQKPQDFRRRPQNAGAAQRAADAQRSM